MHNPIQTILSWFQSKPNNNHDKLFEQHIQTIIPILPQIKGTKLYYMIIRYQQNKKRIYI